MSDQSAAQEDADDRVPDDRSDEGAADGDDAHRPNVDVGDLRAKAAFAGSVVIHGDFVVGEGRKQLITVDIAKSVSDRAAPFIPPQNFAALKTALSTQEIVVMQAPDHYGRRLTAASALLELDRPRVFLIPGPRSSEALVQNVKLLAQGESRVGIVASGVDDRIIRQLVDHGFSQLQAIADETSCVVLIICESLPHDVDIVEQACVSLMLPPSRNVLDAYATHFNVDVVRHRLAVEALEQLGVDLTPLAIIQLLDHCQRVDNDTVANDVVARFNGTQSEKRLAAWLQEERSARDIASLVAGAAFSDELESLAHEAVSSLEGILDARPADGHEPGSYSSQHGWPTGIIERSTREQPVHFGKHVAHTIRLCEPHTQEWVMDHLWKELGGQFQSDLVEWLHLLSQSQLRLHAANAAGLLFLHDPIVIEARLLRPWAMSDDVRQRQSAGWAIGVPSIWGTDASASRGLAKSWLRGGNDRLKHAAIIALGGPLGQWDLESYAPLLLFEAGYANLHLIDATNQAIVNLLVADPDASATRSVALGLLATALDEPEHRLRVYSLLSISTKRYFGRDHRSRQSFASVRSEAEQYEVFITILTEALVDPLGVAHGTVSLKRMLSAASTGDFAERDLIELLDSAKLIARRQGKLRRLGDVLRQTLEAGWRQDDAALKSTCRRMLDRYF